MFLSKSDARSLLERALAFAKADETEISLSGGWSGNLRFAQNMPTTTGKMENLSLSVLSVYGKRVGSFTTTEIDVAALERAVRQAEEAANLAPENPEYLPRLGAQPYVEPESWDESIATFTPEQRASVCGASIAAAKKNDLQSAGYWVDGAGFTAVMNSKGRFAYHTGTHASYTLTMRTNDGSGSGWNAQESFAAKHIDGSRITARAIQKALASQKPQPIEPGVYPVVLEPSAAGDMLNLLSNSMERRDAEEGRSFFADPVHGSKIGQHVFGDNISIHSDHTHPIVPSIPWGEDGLALGPVSWIERGVLNNLICSRFWASEKGHQRLPAPTNAIMEGDKFSIDDLVASMEHGLLVTSFWYIREVDPRTILYTGLTRDGVFLVEKGKIVRPVINLRWNESPASVYKARRQYAHACPRPEGEGVHVYEYLHEYLINTGFRIRRFRIRRLLILRHADVPIIPWPWLHQAGEALQFQREIAESEICESGICALITPPLTSHF
jgi:predicted Zn-dependent protease